MIANLVKVSLVATAVLLSACSGSGMSSRTDYSTDAVAPAGFGPGPANTGKQMNFHGNALSNSFGEYGAGLLHDD